MLGFYLLALWQNLNAISCISSRFNKGYFFLPAAIHNVEKQSLSGHYGHYFVLLEIFIRLLLIIYTTNSFIFCNYSSPYIWQHTMMFIVML